MGVEFLELFEGLIGCHYDLDVLELREVGQDGFRLVLAMVAVRAEEHDDGLMVLFDVFFREIGAAIELQQVEGRNCREALIRGLIGGGVLCCRYGCLCLLCE